MAEINKFEVIYAEEVYLIPPPVIVVIGEPWNKLNEEHRQLLNKILQSVRLSVAAVRIIHQSEFDASGLSEKPSRIIAFIKPPQGLTSYEVIQTGETAFVFSDLLSQLMADDAAKRKLWGALKTLFSL